MSPLMQVTDSFRRCLESPDFFTCFYELLLSRSPDLKPLFESVDMATQEVMVRKGVTSMIMHAAGVRSATDNLAHIATSHGGGGLGIHPGQFHVWINTLIETVRAFDPRFNSDLQDAWKEVLQKGMKHICPETGKTTTRPDSPVSAPLS